MIPKRKTKTGNNRIYGWEDKIMNITAEMVKELRERTGSGLMDCKKALIESNGDMEKAIEYLREKGLATAAKKAGRIAAEGIVDAYIHGGGRIGVLVEVNVETDFAAKNEEFRSFVKDIAMQIAASNPQYVRREEVPQEVIEREKEILMAQAINEGKPAQIAEKMVNGRLEKFFKEVCLLEQPFIKDTDKTVQDVLNEKIAKIGENINIRRFARFEMGEGLAKREDNFAEEVMKQLNK
ncbi:elongation factor Ts [Thermoclostridium stercorarium subsp. stercorarium DSM 8532]|uniref:Elongation factor Ts n=3 Tax=Thermoclostridium stercorarium TaxID=1510 RepID=L7VPI5_THES1|nr:elongation factor Ts [Thermoclostridium stercorarium subsp. stercorarium DSM 8532]